MSVRKSSVVKGQCHWHFCRKLCFSLWWGLVVFFCVNSDGGFTGHCMIILTSRESVSNVVLNCASLVITCIWNRTSLLVFCHCPIYSVHLLESSQRWCLCQYIWIIKWFASIAVVCLIQWCTDIAVVWMIRWSTSSAIVWMIKWYASIAMVWSVQWCTNIAVMWMITWWTSSAVVWMIKWCAGTAVEFLAAVQLHIPIFFQLH